MRGKTGPIRSTGAIWLGLVVLMALGGCVAPAAPRTAGPSPVAGAFPVPGTAAMGDGKPGRAVEIQGFEHVGKGEPHAAYNSSPPTSGPHWSIVGEAPVPWGIYRDPVPEEAQVHNLEHGGVLVQYSCRDCDELVTQLERFYQQYTAAHPLPRYPQSTKLIVAPYFGMTSRIALTAWGRIETLDEYDEVRITRFVEAFRDRGPEAVP